MFNPFKTETDPDKLAERHGAFDKTVILVAFVISAIGLYLIFSPPDFSVLDKIPQKYIAAPDPQAERLPADEMLVPIYGPEEKK